MWQHICITIFVLIYLSNKSESNIISYNITTEIELANLSYHDQQKVDDIDSFKKAACNCINGDCVEKNGKMVCQCWNEYGSVDGDNSNCKACNCGKGSNCTITTHWIASDLIECICKEGYKVKKKTCVGPCTENPCQNGGSCRDEKVGYSCHCNAEFSGKNCEERNYFTTSTTRISKPTTHYFSSSTTRSSKPTTHYVSTSTTRISKPTTHYFSTSTTRSSKPTTHYFLTSTTRSSNPTTRHFTTSPSPNSEPTTRHVSTSPSPSSKPTTQEKCECLNGYCIQYKGKTKCKCWPGYWKLSDTECFPSCVPDCVYGKCENHYGRMKCRCDDNYEGPACNKRKLKESSDFIYLIVAGILCFCCIQISLISLVIVVRKFKRTKE